MQENDPLCAWGEVEPPDAVRSALDCRIGGGASGEGRQGQAAKACGGGFQKVTPGDPVERVKTLLLYAASVMAHGYSLVRKRRG